MQDTFARATHSAYAAVRPSARDDRVSCIQRISGRRKMSSLGHSKSPVVQRLGWISHLVIGWGSKFKGGSIVTSLHTSCIRAAFVFLTSLSHDATVQPLLYSTMRDYHYLLLHMHR